MLRISSLFMLLVTDSISGGSTSSASTSNKRLRVSPASVPNEEDIVMGSQSGEEDSYPSPRNGSASSLYTQKDSPPMTNSPSNSGYDSLFDGTSHDSSPFGPSISRAISPSPTAEDINISSLPTAMSSADKTAQMIANIKARAFADVPSSPEDEKLPDFKDVLDSSSDEEEENVIVPVNKPDKGKAKART